MVVHQVRSVATTRKSLRLGYVDFRQETCAREEVALHKIVFSEALQFDLVSL